eukprot:TRINITY_DN16647_c0_g1_i1.p1 TRINITY_DN16647_c0_g1~~TRINITY_DN16647_c0_g1_i1.p1  ORF type:complete len:478 (+),score=134.56 TRINITY_DN16647_c0_g1_i1:107-1435(+)
MSPSTATAMPPSTATSSQQETSSAPAAAPTALPTTAPTPKAAATIAPTPSTAQAAPLQPSPPAATASTAPSVPSPAAQAVSATRPSTAAPSTAPPAPSEIGGGSGAAAPAMPATPAATAATAATVAPPATTPTEEAAAPSTPAAATGQVSVIPAEPCDYDPQRTWERHCVAVDMSGISRKRPREEEHSPNHEDSADLLKIRERLQHHAHRFETNKTNQQPRSKQKKIDTIEKNKKWVDALQRDVGFLEKKEERKKSELLMKEIFPVASWTAFANDPDGDILPPLIELLNVMLSATARLQLELTCRERAALRHVKERMEDIREDDQDDEVPLLPELIEAIEHATTDVPGPGSGSIKVDSQHESPGTWGRTDQLLVRRVLGGRAIPANCAIRWDGRPDAMRWYASVPGHSHLAGSNATRRRYTDEEAILHCEKAIWKWVESKKQ